MGLEISSSRPRVKARFTIFDILLQGFTAKPYDREGNLESVNTAEWGPWQTVAPLPNQSKDQIP
jgi:hypothetical protein